MKKSTILSAIVVLLTILIIGCGGGSKNPIGGIEKKNIETHYLTKEDNESTVNVKNGDRIVICLNNPGDGGYVFDEPKFDSKYLKLEKHLAESPQENAAGMPAEEIRLGNFGKDQWNFSVLNPGQTEITIKIFHPWNPDDKRVIFRITLNIAL